MASTVGFHLPANMTIAHVHGLHEQFESLVDKKEWDSLVLYGDEVQRIDTAGVQLLLALILATKERQIDVKWDHPSAKLESAASILGLSGELGLH